jgi:hypothetical protein
MLTATVTADGQHIHLRGRQWSDTFPATDLPAKIALYETLRDRKGGAYAQHYEPTVKALQRAQKTYEILNRPKETKP